MAILWMDGFEDGPSANTVGGSFTTGRGGGAGLGLPMHGEATIRIPNAVTDTLCASFAIKNSGGQVGRPIISFLGDSASVSHVYLTVNSAGALSAYNSNGTLLSSVTPGFVPNIWWHLEVRVRVSDTIGTCQVWFNGTQVISAINADTMNGGVSPNLDSIRFGGSNGVDFWIDDLVVYNATGSANSVSPIGDSVVEHLRPMSPDIQADWIGSDGNSTDNWDLLNETGGLVPTDYIWSSTVDATDIYTLTNPARASGTVLGVMSILDGERTDTGTRSVAPVLREKDGTVREGTSVPLLYGSIGVIPMVCDRLSSGGSWTIAELQGLAAGVRLKG